MTATVPDVDTFEHLDFKPACQSTDCKADNPPATHTARGLICSCLILYCTDCATRAARNLDRLGKWFCACCATYLGLGHGTHFFRIEPLP